MNEREDIIMEISLTVVVDGVLESIEAPVPFGYEGQEILDLIFEDIIPVDFDEAAAILALGEEGLAEADETECVDRDAGLSAIASIDDIEGLDYLISLEDIAGQMTSDDYENWSLRARDLQEIDWLAYELYDAGLTPGEWPGLHDERTGELSTFMLDETIDHDLHNVTIIANETKAAFRAMREACGASQAALAEALGVNARTVKRWETPGQPEPPRDAWGLVEAWHADTVAGARWHVHKAEELRDDCHEAYTLVLYRSQEEFDRALAPLLANAPSYHWQDALAEARKRAIAERGDNPAIKADCASMDDWALDELDAGRVLEIDHDYTNFPGTRSFWRANAAARLAAVLMDERGIPHGFAYPDEQQSSLFWEGVWVPRADVQRIEGPGGTTVVCGMR